MWVRTQDKLGLFELNGGRIREHGFENGTKEYLVLNNDNLYNHLGTYKSKERALEVLDEIQRLIEYLKYMEYAIDNNKFCGYRPNVYQMPKE